MSRLSSVELCLALLPRPATHSIGGNLKDLKSDRETGFKTIAVTRGATIAPTGPVPGRRYRRYCWNVQVITTLSLLVTAGLAVQGRRWPEV